MCQSPRRALKITQHTRLWHRGRAQRMKCSVLLAQIRGEGGLAAPCPRRRWLKVWSGEGGSRDPTTRWQGASGGGGSRRCWHRHGCWTSSLGEGSCKSSGGEDPPSAVTGLFCICSVRRREEFYCGCAEELSQEVALWLADPSVERKASQMQHIVSLAALYSTAASRSGCEHCSAKELKSFFF